MIKKMLDLALIVLLLGVAVLAADIYTNGAISGAFTFRDNAIAEGPAIIGNESKVPIDENLTPMVPSPAPKPPSEDVNASRGAINNTGGNATAGSSGRNTAGSSAGGSSPPSPQPPVFPEVPNGTHFSFDANRTDRWTDFYGNLTIGGKPAQIGDEVAAFDPDGVLCGIFRVRFAGIYGFMHVYGDDSSTAEDEGVKTGDVLTFKVYDKSDDLEINAVPSANASWTEKGMVAADLRA